MISYKYDHVTIDGIQTYFYSTTSSMIPDFDYNNDGLTDMHDYDHDVDDGVVVNGKYTAWNAYDLDYVINTDRFGTKRGVTIYTGEKSDEVVYQSVGYKRGGGIDTITTYGYRPDGYTRATAVQDKIYDQAAGLRRLFSEMEYVGYSGREKVRVRTSYERDGVTVSGITDYTYNSTTGQMLESRLKVKLGSGQEVLQNITYYSGKKGEEQVDKIEHYEGIPGGMLQQTEQYQYDEETRALLRTETYDKIGILEKIVKYGSLPQTGTGLPSPLTVQGEEIMSEIITYFMDGTINSRVVYAYTSFAVDFTKTYGPADDLLLYTEYEGDEGDERMMWTQNFEMETKTVYYYDYSTVTYACDAPLLRTVDIDTSPTGGYTTSETYYAGKRGMEVKDYTIQLEPDGQRANRTDYFYGIYSTLSIALPSGGFTTTTTYTTSGAALAGKYDPMVRSDLRYYYYSANPALQPLSPLVSQTWYKGPKGYEIRDYGRSYELDGKTVRETITYVYDDFGALDKVINTIGKSQVVSSETDYFGVKGKEKINTVVTYGPVSDTGELPPGLKMDINKDGKIDDVDVHLLSESISTNLDINNDGKYDYNDIEYVNSIVEAMIYAGDNQAILAAGIYSADTNSDGTVDDTEISAMRTKIDKLADVDLDGQYTGKDIDAIQRIITFLSNFDSDGDGESDQDEYANGSDPFNQYSNSGTSLLAGVNMFAASTEAIKAYFASGNYTSGSYGIAGGATMTVLPSGEVSILTANGNNYNVLPSGTIIWVSGSGEGEAPTGLMPAQDVLTPQFVKSMVDWIKSQEAPEFNIVETVRAFLDNVQSEYSNNYGDQTFNAAATILAATNPVLLTSAGITSICGWLVTQTAQLVNCAAHVAAGYLASKGKPQEIEKVAASLILEDILSGVYGPQTQGDLSSSLYAISKFTESIGLPMVPVSTDLNSLRTLTPPYLAVIDSDGRDHSVLVKKIVSNTVIIESDGVATAMDVTEFASRYKGYALLPLSSVRNMTAGVKTVTTTPSGSEIGITRDGAGNVTDITFNLVPGENKIVVINEMISRAMSTKTELENYAIELSRLGDNVKTLEMKNMLNEQRQKAENDIAKISNYIVSMNAFRGLVDTSRITLQGAVTRSTEIVSELSGLKNEIAALQYSMQGKNIREQKVLMSNIVEKKREMEILINEINLITPKIDPTETGSRDEINAKVYVAKSLMKDAVSKSDGASILLGATPDADGDGYSDEEEITAKTNAMDHKDTPIATKDTDGDGYSDSLEILKSSNPSDQSMNPANKGEFNYEADGRTDSDGDGSPDWIEAIAGTDPFIADSDSDGFTDYEELRLKTDPLIASSNPGSPEMKALAHTPTWKVGMLSLDSIEKADINADGELNINDIIDLSSMMNNFADLNGDRKLNGADLTRMENILYFASLNISMQDIDQADISGPNGVPDGRVDSWDLNAMSDSLEYYKDVTGNGVVDEEDIAIVRQLKTLGLSTVDISAADIDNNGIVNSADIDMLERVLAFSQGIIDDPWKHIDYLDKVIEYLNLSDVLFSGIIEHMDIDGNGTTDINDLHKLSDVLADISDVNMDGEISRDDCDRILQIIGPGRFEQLINAEEIRRANVDNVGEVTINDHEFIQMMYQRLHTADVNGDGKVSNTGPGNDLDAIQKIIQYNGIIDQWDITPAVIDSVDFNHNGKVDSSDKNFYDTAFNILYSDVTRRVNGVTWTYAAADFNYDGKVDDSDGEYLRLMIEKLKNRNDNITDAKWADIINGIKSADFNGDHLLDDTDKLCITTTMDKLKDVDGNMAIGDDSYRYDYATGLILLGGNGVADDIDKIRLVMNQDLYHFTNAEVERADVAGGNNPNMPYGGPDGKVDQNDVVAFHDAVDNYQWRDLDGTYGIDARDIGLINTISQYQLFKDSLGDVDSSRLDVDGEDGTGVIRGNSFINQSDVDAMTRHMTNLVDIVKDNTIDQKDKDLFLSIGNDAVNGYLPVNFFGISSAMVVKADVNGDGRISVADRTLMIARGSDTDQANDVNIDGDSAGYPADSDEMSLFDIIQKYINDYKWSIANINGDNKVDIADYNNFRDNFTSYQTSGDLGKYDINGDDQITQDDVAELKHIVEDYDQKGITKAMYDKCDTQANTPETIVKVDINDINAFKRSYGYDSWGNCNGSNLGKLDVNDDGNVNADDLKFIKAKVTAGLNIQVFSDEIMRRADATGDLTVDYRDGERLQWAIDTAGNLYAAHGREAVSRIITYLTYKEAKTILETYDFDNANGQVDTAAEISAMKGHYTTLTDQQAVDKIGWANRNGVLAQHKVRANVDGDLNIDGDDITRMQGGLNDISKYNIVHEAADDNKGIATINDKDLARMVELIGYIQDGAFGGNIYDRTGKLIGVGDLLSVIYSGNLDGEGEGVGIEENDLLTFTDSRGYVKDVFWTPSEAGNNLINRSDLEKVNVMASLESLGVDPIWLSELRGDLDGNKIIESNDITLINDIITKQLQYDVNDDEYFTQEDVDIVEEIMIKRLTAEGLAKADINGDQKIDRVDWKMLDDAITVATGTNPDGSRVPGMLGIDVNGDGKWDTYDVAMWLKGQRFNELEQFLDDAGINIQGRLFDVVDANGHLVPDGKIDEHDRKALADALSKLKVDITGDQQMTDDDMTKARDIIDLMGTYGLSVEMLTRADVDGDEHITINDVTKITNAVSAVKDVNGDGKYDIADMKKVKEVADYMRLKKIYGKDQLMTADRDGDGLISDTERSELLAVMNYYVDVDGDKVVTDADITELTDALTYMRLDVTSDEFARANLNGEGNVDDDDLNVMTVAVEMFDKCDINGDGKVTDADKEAITNIARFMSSEYSNALTYNLAAIKKVDLNNDGVVDQADVNIIDYYLSAKWDLGGTKGMWDTEDISIMTKIVDYFRKKVDNQVRLYADVDGDGIITGTDIQLLGSYLDDIKKGDFKGNGPVTEIAFASYENGVRKITLTEENSYDTEISNGVYTTVISDIVGTEQVDIKICIEASTKTIWTVVHDTSRGMSKHLLLADRM
ncbi:MAG: hypothetical protein HQL30_07210 [Candidatus Omnitrophica bacterium]|nr:hypothetical protein [Candidatus Omnitrophota bacterium]